MATLRPIVFDVTVAPPVIMTVVIVSLMMFFATFFAIPLIDLATVTPATFRVVLAIIALLKLFFIVEIVLLTVLPAAFFNEPPPTPNVKTLNAAPTVASLQAFPHRLLYH